MALRSRTLLWALLLPIVHLTSPALAQATQSDPDAAAYATGIVLLAWTCVGLAAIFSIATLVAWVFMLVDCFQREPGSFPNATENTKTIWIVALLVSWLVGLHWLAAILYFVLVKRKMPLAGA